MANHEDDMTAHELPLEMSRDKLARHRYANVESEFCYLPYAEGDDDDDDDDDMHILPPVTKLDKIGRAIAHAVVCAVEARYHRQKIRCYPPKSMWRCSVKSLIQTMTTRTKQEGDWSMKSISEAILESGIGLTVDEKTSDHPEQLRPGPKYRGVYLRSFKRDDQLKYEDVYNEIEACGPIIALIQPLKEDFEDWSSELARERVYSGFSPLTKHAVVLIGVGWLNDGSIYFIAQNCYGEEWGDKGVFRMLPDDIVDFFSPVVPGST